MMILRLGYNVITRCNTSPTMERTSKMVALRADRCLESGLTMTLCWPNSFAKGVAHEGRGGRRG